MEHDDITILFPTTTTTTPPLRPLHNENSYEHQTIFSNTHFFVHTKTKTTLRLRQNLKDPARARVRFHRARQTPGGVDALAQQKHRLSGISQHGGLVVRQRRPKTPRDHPLLRNAK